MTRTGEVAGVWVATCTAMTGERRHGWRTRRAPWKHLLHADTSFPDGSAVLEAGCGTGAQTVAIARRSPGARITAVDISVASLEEARARVSAAGFGNVEFRQADLLALPFRASLLRPHLPLLRAGTPARPCCGACGLAPPAPTGRHDYRHRGRPRLDLLPPRERGRALLPSRARWNCSGGRAGMR